MHSKKIILPKGFQLVSGQGMTNQVGFGSRGAVFLAKCLKSGETVAIKKINQKTAQQEIEFHKKLSHPNIIKMLGYQVDEKGQNSLIILEYAENGTLFDHIREMRHSTKDTRLINGIFYSLCDAVQYLHSQHIIHRDIKPENVLLDCKNTVKLCDFGSATGPSHRTSLGGTIEYMAPEVLAGRPYDHRVDIWALGVLYYELIQGHSPFQCASFESAIEKAEKPIEFSSKFSLEEAKFISWILKPKPEDRPQLKQIMASSFLSGESTPTKYSEFQFSERPTQIPKISQSGIKLLQVKNLVNNPEQKKRERCSQNGPIKIVSIRDYIRHSESPTTIGYHSGYAKPERVSLISALSREKISLKRAHRR